MVIFVTDARGKATYIAPEWQALTGQSAARARNFGWSAVVHPDDREIVRGTVVEAVQAQAEFTTRYRLMRPKGEFVWVIAGAVPAFGPPGRTFLGFLGSIIQLTDPGEEDRTAYGALGPLHANRPTQIQPAGSVLERAADHLIMAHSLLSEDGGKNVLPVLETALHLVGIELARAEQTGNPNNLH